MPSPKEWFDEIGSPLMEAVAAYMDEVAPTTDPDTLPLSDEQQFAYNTALTGGNLLITGLGGAGKSFTLNRIIRDLTYPVASTASTGIAAIQINGSTIHSYLGTRIAKHPRDIQHLFSDCDDDNHSKTCERRTQYLSGEPTILVDEVSMLSGDYIEMIDTLLRHQFLSDTPFGGKQMLFSGDFLQLPPVEKGTIPDYKFAFDSPAWQEADIQVVELTKSFRQSDQLLVDALNSIRYGTHELDLLEIFNPCVGRDLGPDPTHLMGTNSKADQLNVRRLQQHPGDHINHQAHQKDDASPRGRACANSLRRNVLAPENLTLKPGVPVLLLKNDYNQGFRNGSRGVVTDDGLDDPNSVFVQLEDTEQVVEVTRHTWEQTGSHGRKVAEYTQFPMRLGWAITIHKSQGMSLDRVNVNLENIFAPGQLYVALSRAVSLEGLALSQQINPSMLKVAPEAVQFYRDHLPKKG